jgi:hypothetical protein
MRSKVENTLSNMLKNTERNMENQNPNQQEQERSHFEDIEIISRCTHPEHNPPMHLHIPQGKRYVHICPYCRHREILQPPQISFSVQEFKSPEQILNEHDLNFDWMSSKWTKNMTISAMEEYANQFKK